MVGLQYAGLGSIKPFSLSVGARKYSTCFEFGRSFVMLLKSQTAKKRWGLLMQVGAFYAEDATQGREARELSEFLLFAAFFDSLFLLCTCGIHVSLYASICVCMRVQGFWTINATPQRWTGVPVEHSLASTILFFLMSFRSGTIPVSVWESHPPCFRILCCVNKQRTLSFCSIASTCPICRKHDKKGRMAFSWAWTKWTFTSLLLQRSTLFFF